MSKDLVHDRRLRAAAAWNLTDEIVLVGAGQPINKPGGFDQCFAFQVHPQYRWLAEAKRASSVLAFDLREGWVHFVEPLGEKERVWDGEPEVPMGEPLEGLPKWLEQRSGRKIGALGIFGDAYHGTRASSMLGVAFDADLTKSLNVALDHERRKKDAHELNLMRRAALATAAGYEAASNFIRPGVTEREIQVELETAFFRGGGDGTGYASIVGTGSNSRIFHFTPGAREVQDEDLVLIDAGANVEDYVIDVTRTFPASANWAGRQAEVRTIVRAAQEAVFAQCRKGNLWSTGHRAAAMTIAEGLRDLKIATCSAEDFCESGAIALFLPHGVGHAVGLGVRDSGGGMPGDHGEAKMVCGVTLRVDLPLEAGYVMTVEPGLYMIPALLEKPENRQKFASQIDFSVADEWLDFGGIRLEDNLVITEDEPENLTVAIPW